MRESGWREDACLLACVRVRGGTGAGRASRGLGGEAACGGVRVRLGEQGAEGGME